MTVKPLGNGQYQGLSSDTKPIPANTVIDATYEETDTGKKFYNSGTDWIPRNVKSHGSMVWQDIDGKFYAQDSNGDLILSHNSSAQTVMQAALDLAGFVRVFPGTYTPTTAWTLSPKTYVKIMPNANFRITEGYTGAVWRLYSGQASNVKKNITIDGGDYLETGSTPDRLWTVVQMEVDRTGAGSDDGGIVNCKIKNIYVKYCGKMIQLKTAGVVQGGFINDNYFQRCWADYSRNAVSFEAAAQPILASGTHNNVFEKVVVQDDPNANYPLENGFKDIGGWNNTFINCNVWDIIVATSAAIPCNLSAATANNTGAHNTNFIGCDMFRVPVDWELVYDKGENTTIIGGINTGGGYEGYLPSPFIKKVGIWEGVGTSGSNSTGMGLLDAFGVIGGTVTASVVMDANGLARSVSTGTTSGTQIGFNSVLITARGFSPYLKIKVKLNQLTDTRFFVGYNSGANPLVMTSDDPLNALSGFGIAYSSTSPVSSTNWLRINNDGTDATVTGDTGIPATTDPTIFHIALYDSLSGGRIRVGNNNAGALVTADIPAQYTQLRVYTGVCNTSGNAKTMDGYMAYLKQDGR